jgi:hypothetical protein
LDDEHLTLGEANNIRRANTDENLVVTVDASKLEVRQSTAFNKKGRAKGKVTGDDWYVHGSVTLQMDLNTGQVQIVEGKYNFEWRDDRSLKGNLLTVGGNIYSRIDSGSNNTDYLIRYKNSPKIVYPKYDK